MLVCLCDIFQKVEAATKQSWTSLVKYIDITAEVIMEKHIILSYHKGDTTDTN